MNREWSSTETHKSVFERELGTEDLDFDSVLEKGLRSEGYCE